MLRSALDNDGNVVFADGAKSSLNYYCPTCSEPLRLKKGLIRAPHFFHLARTPECRMSEKTYLHALIQEILFHRLPCEEKYLEKGFPEIGRIADLVSFDMQAVFEVQISPIDVREMHRRRIDYAKEALSIVWILHERRFGKKVIDYPIYYLTDIDDEGVGRVFDPMTGPIDIRFALRLKDPIASYRAGQIYFRGDRIWEALEGGLQLKKHSLKSRYRAFLLRFAKGLTD